MIFNLFDDNVHVDTVEKRAGEFFLVAIDVAWVTGALMGGVAEIATGAGIHGGDEHKIGGIGGFLVGARDGDSFVFEWLAEGLKDGTRELGDFVEEENAFVGERNFARGSVFATTDNRNRAGGVVGATKGASGDDFVGFETSEGVDFSGSELFFECGCGEEIGGDFGKEGFAGAGWAGDEEIVVAGDSNLKGTFGKRLTTDMVEERGRIGRSFRERLGAVFGVFGEGFLLFKVEKEFLKIVDTEGGNARDEAGLGKVFDWQIDLISASLEGSFDDIDNAFDGAEVTVQGEFTDEETVF